MNILKGCSAVGVTKQTPLWISQWVMGDLRYQNQRQTHRTASSDPMPDDPQSKEMVGISDGYNVYLYGELTHMASVYVQQCIAEAIVHGRRNQNLIISSGGGAVVSGLDIVSSIRSAQAQGIKIYGRVNSMAGSMAAYVLQACDWRSISPIAQLMLHGWEESSHGVDKKAKAIQEQSTKQMEAILVGLVKERSHLSQERIDEIFADSYYKYFSADEALEAGLVDEVTW